MKDSVIIQFVLSHFRPAAAAPEEPSECPVCRISGGSCSCPK